MSVSGDPEVELIRASELFDAAWYVQNNPDVAMLKISPEEHYRKFGQRLGRHPSPQFDAAAYFAANPDLDPEKIDALVHYEIAGRKEGREIRPKTPRVRLARESGTIIIVSHDAEVGGAQQVVLTFAEWLLESTKYDVKLVVMRGGMWTERFQRTAPTFNIADASADRTPEELGQDLAAWAGPGVKAVFMNSVASGGFLRHWPMATPVVSFIHELPKIIAMFKDEFALILDRAQTIIGGSEAVCEMLRRDHGVQEERLGRVYGFIEARWRSDFVDPAMKQAAKQALGLEGDDVLITASGVMHWRKSPDIFVEVADRVARRIGPSAKFVWIGGGPDHRACEQLAAARGLSGVFKVTGHVPDIVPYLKAADIFVLPSEEDPFPLACLYAEAACAPVVCFEDAGGIPELVRRGCGKAVPFGDVEAMAEAVVDYILNPGARAYDGTIGQEIVAQELTIAATGPQLLDHIRRAAGLKPHVTVVVPNYNCAPYLEERLSSIDRQSFQDFELILLDDKSTDESLPILERWSRRRPGVSLILNDQNSGSPFVQWLRGVEAAESDLIWMAEADDFCDPRLLEELVASFEDGNVNLGYVKSVPVDAQGTVLGDYEGLYLNRIQPGRWRSSYVATDHEEANFGLGIANCIPNASSMMFRRFKPEPEFVEQVTAMRLCGDWYFYLRAMRGGLVAYTARPFNFHRRHPQTVTSQTEGSLRYFDEFAVTRDYVSRTYRQGEAARQKIVEFTRQDLDRFGVSEPEKRDRVLQPLLQPPQRKRLPALLVVLSDLGPGGGQLFGIQLANAWARRGGRVVLFNTAMYPDHPQVIAKIDPRVAMFRHGGAGADFADIVRRFDIEMIHSSMWWADRYVDDRIARFPRIPWVTTLHGCYETIIANPGIDVSFPRRVARMLDRVDMWVVTAAKNRQVFQVHGKPRSSMVIANGVEPARNLQPVASRSTLGLREDSVVLLLATRAIREKGWFQAVEMTRQLNAAGHRVDLMLVGEGPAADEIAALKPPHVHLYGHVSNLPDYIAAADIGLLPSYFIGESMPLVLLDMMAQGKPVIASDAGEIPDMLGEGGDAGGIVVPLSNGEPDVPAYIRAIEALLPAEARSDLGARAKQRFEQRFHIESMVDAYAAVYLDLIARRRLPGENAAA